MGAGDDVTDDTLPLIPHVHEFRVAFRLQRAPIGPAPAHTAFVVMVCECGELDCFPAENYALCTEEFKAHLRAVAAAWRGFDGFQ